MLNGKFYTGLPPKMIERSNSQVSNRLESHFYWPDDTDTETAVETRVRRRASLSLAPANKPLVQKRNDNNDEVNTKQMLHNQFSKSSIQFFDNINEADEEEQPFKRATKREITCKPTATKLALPESDADAAALKNKHMFESKLQFNDFIGEDLNKRNNLRTNKIDMNNKLEVERNSKNSPKLQNKRNVQNLIQYNSEDEERELQRKSRAKALESRNRNNNKYRRDQTPKRILKPAMRNGVDYSDYPECRDEDFYNEATDQMDTAFKHMQINGRRPILKKRVSYSEEEEEIPVRHYYKRRDNYVHYKDDDDDDDNDDEDKQLYLRKHKNQYKFEHSHAYAPNGRRTQPSNDLDQDHEQFMEKQNNMNGGNGGNDNHENSNALGKSVNNSNNNYNNTNNNNRVLNVAQKHLRSSLCFHDGEIVGSDNEATTSSTSSNQTGQRRNARSSATKRVSVGLPD